MGQDGRHGPPTREPVVRPRSRGRQLCQELIRIDTSNYGNGDGPGERKAAEYVAGAARRGRHREHDHRGRAGSRQRRGPLGRRRRATAAAGPRAPRRGARGGRRLAGRPVRRRDQGRHGLGPGRGRHEGLRRDAAQRRTRTGRGGCGSRPRGGGVLHRRRGGRRPSWCRDPDQRARRPARRLHRGRGRGRRLLRHRPRAPGLPDRGRREGHGLDAAHRARPGRPRLDAQRRQRRHPARPAPSPASGPTSGRCA